MTWLIPLKIGIRVRQRIYLTRVYSTIQFEDKKGFLFNSAKWKGNRLNTPLKWKNLHFTDMRRKAHFKHHLKWTNHWIIKKVQKLITLSTDLSAHFQLSTNLGINHGSWSEILAFLKQLHLSSPIWIQTRSLHLGHGTSTHTTMNEGSQCQTWDHGQLSGHITWFWYSLECSLTLQTLSFRHPRSTPHVASLWYFRHSNNQCVALSRILSSPLPVKAGVIQGSDLGPVFFLNFINDLSDPLENPLYRIADDSTLYRDITPPSDWQAAASSLSPDFDKITRCSNTWNTSFNPVKSHDLSFSLWKDQMANPPVYFLHNPPHEDQSIKLLHLTISNDLSWTNHISKLAWKVSHRRVLFIIHSPSSSS